MYGSRFADLWRGCDLAAVKATWAADLAVMSRDELAAGVAACRSRDWPPTLPEFMKLCRPPIDFDGALSEAVEQMARRESGSDRWSHPAIFWAAQSIAFELRNSPRKVLDGLWRSSLGAQLAKGQWPDIPDRQAAALQDWSETLRFLGRGHTAGEAALIDRVAAGQAAGPEAAGPVEGADLVTATLVALIC